MSMPSTLSRKLQKVLETKTDSPDLLVALQNLSTFYATNTPAARTNLRGEIEKRGLEINNDFLASFKEVQKQLDELQKDVDEMRTCCSDMNEKLQQTKTASGRLIENADKLREERKKNETCTAIVDAFLDRFQLTEDELHALQSQKLTESFFAALQRVHQIQADCKLLLRTQHSQAGIEIMDSMSMHQQAAYQRLQLWVLEEVRSLENDATEPEYDLLIQPALKALRARPGSLGKCLDEIGNYRCKAIVKGFINALTIGGPNGMPRPIELHAHDPIRYVGDMLAWIHQALASEHELLHNLIGPDSDSEYIATSQNLSASSLLASTSLSSSSTSNLSSSNHPNNPSISRSASVSGLSVGTGATNLVRVLNITFDGICKPFKVRVEQVLLTKPGIVIVFRIANLLDFYARTITNLMAHNSPLPVLFNECKQDCLKVFYDDLKDHAEKLKQNPPVPPADLSPPPAIRDTVAKLKDLISTFNASLVPNAERAIEFTPILHAIVDPLLQTCQLSATITRLDFSSMAVFLINCISSLMVILVQYEFTVSRVEMLNAQIEAHTDTLVEEQTSRLLQNCGLAQKLSIIQYRADSQKPLSQELGMEKFAITETVRAFEASMIELGVLVVPHCDKLINPKIRGIARKSIAKMVTTAYTTFHAAILAPESGYENPQAMFKHTPDQVKKILDA